MLIDNNTKKVVASYQSTAMTGAICSLKVLGYTDQEVKDMVDMALDGYKIVAPMLDGLWKEDE